MLWAFLAMVQFVARVVVYTILGITIATVLYHLGALADIVTLASHLST